VVFCAGHKCVEEGCGRGRLAVVPAPEGTTRMDGEEDGEEEEEEGEEGEEVDRCLRHFREYYLEMGWQCAEAEGREDVDAAVRVMEDQYVNMRMQQARNAGSGAEQEVGNVDSRTRGRGEDRRGTGHGGDGAGQGVAAGEQEGRRRIRRSRDLVREDEDEDGIRVQGATPPPQPDQGRRGDNRERKQVPDRRHKRRVSLSPVGTESSSYSEGFYSEGFYFPQERSGYREERGGGRRVRYRDHPSVRGVGRPGRNSMGGDYDETR